MKMSGTCYHPSSRCWTTVLPSALHASTANSTPSNANNTLLATGLPANAYVILGLVGMTAQHPPAVPSPMVRIVRREPKNTAPARRAGRELTAMCARQTTLAVR